MKVQLINKESPITQMWCFKNEGYCSSVVEEINSGKMVLVDKIPKPALEYVKEVKPKKKGDK